MVLTAQSGKLVNLNGTLGEGQGCCCGQTVIGGCPNFCGYRFAVEIESPLTLGPHDSELHICENPLSGSSYSAYSSSGCVGVSAPRFAVDNLVTPGGAVGYDGFEVQSFSTGLAGRDNADVVDELKVGNLASGAFGGRSPLSTGVGASVFRSLQGNPGQGSATSYDRRAYAAFGQIRISCNSESGGDCEAALRYFSFEATYQLFSQQDLLSGGIVSQEVENFSRSISATTFKLQETCGDLFVPARPSLRSCDFSSPSGGIVYPDFHIESPTVFELSLDEVSVNGTQFAWSTSSTDKTGAWTMRDDWKQTIKITAYLASSCCCDEEEYCNPLP